MADTTTCVKNSVLSLKAAYKIISALPITQHTSGVFSILSRTRTEVGSGMWLRTLSSSLWLAGASFPRLTLIPQRLFVLSTPFLIGPSHCCSDVHGCTRCRQPHRGFDGAGRGIHGDRWRLPTDSLRRCILVGMGGRRRVRHEQSSQKVKTCLAQNIEHDHGRGEEWSRMIDKVGNWIDVYCE
jgi:hypothetical protein